MFACLEKAGAFALGINCTAADDALPQIIAKISAAVSVPVICKPNMGRAVNGVCPVSIDKFAEITGKCIANGAALVGGCCGSTPAHIAALKKYTG